MWALFVNALADVAPAEYTAVDPALESLVVAALEHPEIEGSGAVAYALARLRADPAFAPLEADSTLIAATLRATAPGPLDRALLRGILAATIVPDVRFESWTGALRLALADFAIKRGAIADRTSDTRW